MSSPSRRIVSTLVLLALLMLALPAGHAQEAKVAVPSFRAAAPLQQQHEQQQDLQEQQLPEHQANDDPLPPLPPAVEPSAQKLIPLAPAPAAAASSPASVAAPVESVLVHSAHTSAADVAIAEAQAQVEVETQHAAQMKAKAAGSRLPSQPHPHPRTSLQHRGMDRRHAAGDIDVLNGLMSDDDEGTSALDSVSWPTQIALLLVFLAALVCVRRLVLLWRSLGGQDPPSVKLVRVLTSLASSMGFIDLDRRMGLDASLGSERMGLVDGKQLQQQSRARKDVKSTLVFTPVDHEADEEEGTLRQQTSDGAGAQIELNSLSASVRMVHVPQLIHLHAVSDGGEDVTGLSPGPEGSLLTPQLLRQLLPHLPPSVQLNDEVKCQYKLSVCGASLSRLYERCESTRDSLTLIQDSGGYLFGCYVSSAWSIHQTYYGSATCCVFQLHPHFRVYELARGVSTLPGSAGGLTAANTFFQLATREAIAVGGGDHFAIWLDDGLRNGNSRHCDTFNSPSLSSKEAFKCNEVEVWSFAFDDGRW